jgi:hypothetical protein
MKHILNLSPLSDALPLGSNIHIYHDDYAIYHTPERCEQWENDEHPDECMITTSGSSFYADCAGDYGYQEEIRARGFVVLAFLPHGMERVWGAASSAETALLLALHLHNVHQYNQGEHDKLPPALGHEDDEARAAKLRIMYFSERRRLERLVFPNLR